jgi:hypothetical protein
VNCRRAFIASGWCVFALLTGTLTAAPDSQLDAVLSKARQRIEQTDARVTGRLVRVDASGARKTFGFNMKVRWFPEGLSMLIEVTSPEDARMRLLLATEARGVHTIEVAHQQDNAPANLPFSRWGEGLLGTDFSYEDLFADELFWAHQTLVGEEKYGARECFVVKSQPGPADQTHYSVVTSWLDQTLAFPVHVEKVARAGGARKEYIYYGLRETSGVWSANQIEAKTDGRPGSSLLIFERGSAAADLERKDFERSSLTSR